MRRLAVLSAVLAPLTLAALGGCEADGGIAGPERVPFRFGGPSASVNDTIVVGTWSRNVSFIDEFGVPRSSETVWTFNADGTAIRSTITRNLLDGIEEQVDAFARWTIQGDQIVIDFTAPFTGRVQLAFQRQGQQLTLGGQS
jgi:hypothetical protein